MLALYKLGTVIDAVCDLPVSGLRLPVAFALMESLEAVLMAELMPDVEPLAQAIERTWAEGLTPPADVEHDVRQARTQDARRAADIRHAANREAKAEALQLYWSRQYRTIDEAARIISAAVCRSPMTVRNWIFEARNGRDGE